MLAFACEMLRSAAMLGRTGASMVELMRQTRPPREERRVIVHF